MVFADVVSLNDNLKKQVGLYDILINLEQGKQDALIKNDIVALDKVTGQEERVISEYMMLEKECFSLITALAQRLDKKPEELSLVELADTYPLIEEARANLDKAIKTVAELHEINARLIYQGMQVIEYTVGLLSSTNDKSTYTNPNNSNKDDNKSKKLVLDRRV